MALQCIVDMDGGWSGISQKYLEEARSELGNVPILLYGIYDSKNGYSESIKVSASHLAHLSRGRKSIMKI